MAKLSARGRYELARIEREKHLTTEQDPTCDWRRTTMAFMSDGTVLVKRDVRWRDGVMAGEKHSFGWTVKGKLKKGQDLVERVQRLVGEYVKLGWSAPSASKGR